MAPGYISPPGTRGIRKSVRFLCNHLRKRIHVGAKPKVVPCAYGLRESKSRVWSTDPQNVEYVSYRAQKHKMPVGASPHCGYTAESPLLKSSSHGVSAMFMHELFFSLRQLKNSSSSSEKASSAAVHSLKSQGQRARRLRRC